MLESQYSQQPEAVEHQLGFSGFTAYPHTLGAMDKQLGFSQFTGKSLNRGIAEKWTIVRPPVTQSMTCPTQLDVLAQDSMHNHMSRGIKRKWVDLSLGLGNFSSSSDSSKQSMETCCTMSSAKDRGDGSSFDINFQFNLHNEGTSKLDRNNCNGKSVLEKPVDLELSLTVGSCESAVTNVDFSTATKQQSVFLQLCNMSSVPTVVEGSTSARWKSGCKLVPYLYQCGNNISLFSSKELRSSSNQSQDLVPPSATIQLPQSPVTSASGIVSFQQRCNSTKICSQPGCAKGARGSSGRCIGHGGGRRCQREGCKKGAEGKTIFCKAHGGGRRCEYLGCTKSAEGRTDFCIAHGGGCRCSREGCRKAARGKSGLCIKHGGGKRCQKQNCTKSAEGQSGFCIAHGGGRRCKHEGCTKGAQGNTNFCKAHGGGKRCTYLNCTKGAEGSTALCKAHGGGKRCSAEGCPKSVHGGTEFCVAHGGGKRCVVPGCTKSARGRTDCCVRHGGGKRCQFTGCSKSAQGSTDFCKAHGGGKRCLWGQPGSGLGDGSGACERFARGKKGLCVAHNALVEDCQVRGGQTVGAISLPGSTGAGAGGVTHGTLRRNSFNFGETCATNTEQALHHVQAPDPEGRVHGGNIVAMLANGMDYQKPFNFNAEAVTSNRNWL